MTTRITDHALVRWMSRAHDIDVEGYRQALAAIAAPYARLRVKHVEIGGLWFVFGDDGTLVTVLPNRPTPHETCGNDRGNRNGSQDAIDRLHWKAIKRKRAHK